MRRLGIVWIFLALWLCVPVGARAASSVYSAASAVPDQSPASRAKAFSEDLAKVLVKASGDPSAARYAQTMDASKLVLGYRFRKASGDQSNGLELWARFDEKGVNAALAGAGEPIWGKSRPSVIAWVIAPGGMIGSDGDQRLANAMQESAKTRGLPLVLPLLDLTDQKTVSDFDIRSFYFPTLEKASKRYDARAILAGAIKKTGNGVRSKWQLKLAGATTPFPVTAPSAESAAATAVSRAATLIARRYASVPGASPGHSAFVLRVDGVDSLDAEVAVRRALASVQGVKSLKLARVAAGILRFVVAYDGSTEDFARHLALSNALTQSETAPTLSPPAGSRSRPMLSFHYTP